MPRIVHLGFGNFHRAHQAWYTQLANNLDGEQWAITGVSMSRSDLRDALTSNGFQYSLGLRGVEGLEVQPMSAHDELLVARLEPEAVIAAIAKPETQIVSLTITEKGYALDASGRLDLDASSIASDLKSDVPTSGVGLLTRGLWERSKSGAAVTVMCCDNLSGNGALLRQAVSDFAAASDWDMQSYLSEEVSFPDSMVDRITPATTDVTIAEIAEVTGVSEPAPVITETFSEWVIEDHFAGARPDWDKVGAVFTKDVTPFEARKLRFLNGAHSLLAYGGLLRGYTYVHEAIGDPFLKQKVEALWGEAVETLPTDFQPSCAAYCEALIARFEVPAIKHELRQIAMDGTMKLPVRAIATAQVRAEKGQSSPAQCDVLGSWLARGLRSGVVDDPKAAELTELLHGKEPDDELFGAVLEALDWTENFPFSTSDLLAATKAWLD